ncbi:hypothetical protein [Novosphingobium rosa]|uniref:hypothetical protein n=1 Tax=Novosphingobium rosa TaxID=76978 RepID=UPI0012EE5440|nr:hypothetical protein [Novosphingobium rosa]
MTITIRREKHRPRWQRAWMPMALLALVLVVVIALLATAWRLGGPVPVRPVAVALPSTTVGSTAPAPQSAASSGGIGG